MPGLPPEFMQENEPVNSQKTASIYKEYKLLQKKYVDTLANFEKQCNEQRKKFWDECQEIINQMNGLRTNGDDDKDNNTNSIQIVPTAASS